MGSSETHRIESETLDKRVPLFEVAANFIRNNIKLGHLYSGLVLQEGALADRLDMSRATIKRALEIIEGESLIERFSGRGFLVSGENLTPKRVNLRELTLDHDDSQEESGKPSWLRVYDDVAFHVTRSPVFGRCRIVEALVAEEYHVSRTIVRDVLARLQERGLVQKNRTSRWVVDPLSSKKIKDKYELRKILEVAALASSTLPYEPLKKLAQEIGALPREEQITSDKWIAIDKQFFDMMILSTPNEDLATVASNNKLALEACQSALFSLGLPPDTQSIMELGQVIELALSGSTSTASFMLAQHLEKACDRTIAQLKITAIIQPPAEFPSYLQFSQS
ncbi:GntR family transcriptional regulator [Pacificibacter maritimus]|uniref:GntR family transcriptional regulator n=1 Tax=Pacificibacter maritimus TaxID=762213 RepID=A0A3N4V262_9RHOB|nr:GntR family transcriptional regulator [Pacificibacter maritimus]RPE67004.1 GntR family transcriptional regulator [Pacificibacter maritimus]